MDSMVEKHFTQRALTGLEELVKQSISNFSALTACRYCVLKCPENYVNGPSLSAWYAAHRLLLTLASLYVTTSERPRPTGSVIPVKAKAPAGINRKAKAAAQLPISNLTTGLGMD